MDCPIKWNPLQAGSTGLGGEGANANKPGRRAVMVKMAAVLSEDLLDVPGLRRIVKVTGRTSDAQGQLYLKSDISLEGWVVPLPASITSDQQIMVLYCDHDTSAQFHS